MGIDKLNFNYIYTLSKNLKYIHYVLDIHLNMLSKYYLLFNIKYILYVAWHKIIISAWFINKILYRKRLYKMFCSINSVSKYTSIYDFNHTWLLKKGQNGKQWTWLQVKVVSMSTGSKTFSLHRLQAFMMRQWFYWGVWECGGRPGGSGGGIPDWFPDCNYD
jgi:hypothetical protein